MSQAGYTPIQLYYSATAAATPSAGNLAAGELAVNITDGKLFYKDNGGVVRVLATAAGSAGDVVGPGSSTDNALVRFDGTTGKLVQSSVGILSDAGVLTGLTGLTSSGSITFSGLTSGRVTYAGTGGLLQDSANLTFDGTTLTANALTVSNAVTLSGGVANGVAYLNASKVLTTGSALTFDGTNLGVGVLNTNALLTVAGDKTALRVERGSAIGFAYNTGTAATDSFRIQSNAGPVDIYTASGQPITFSAGASEQMRLTSTGLGIGTSSPAAKLDVRGNAVFTGNGTSRQTADFTNTGGQLYVGTESSSGGAVFVGSSAYAGIVGTNTNTHLQLGTNGTIKATLDSSGNLGLGVTPSAWTTVTPVFQIGRASLYGFSTEARLSANFFFNGADRYIANGFATSYNQADGAHKFFTAPSGTAGNAISFTQAMTLDASGNLGLGATSIPGNSTNRVLIAQGSDSANFVVTKTSAESGSFYAFGGAIWAGSNTNHPFIFNTNATERARIDSSGNLLVGTTAAAGAERLNVTGSVANNITRFINTNASPYGPLIQYGSGVDPNGTSNEFIDCRANLTTPRFQVRSNGGIANYSSNNVNLSDRSEKTNFAPAKSYLDAICAIPVQTFNYIDQNMDEDPGLTLGVVAQDVQAVAPELVMESNWGTKEEPKQRLSIYQTDLQYALMKCIQEQQTIINQLKARLDAANL